MNLLTVMRQFFLLTLSALLLASCTKIEKTTLGGDLIPAVDNVFTFDTTLQVIANNIIPADSIFINQSAEHFAGGISDDPFFGSSRAAMYFEMKPFQFPFKFTDSAKIFDSAVLVLRYRGFYGDSTAPVTFQLFEAGKIMQRDTSIRPIYPVNFPHPDLVVNRGRLWGQQTMAANRYRDTIKYTIQKDTIFRSVTNELRIPLDHNLARALFQGDSARVYGSDSIFKSFLPGFVLEALGSPRAIHYFGLSEGSEIQFFYRYKGATDIDTTVRAYGVTSFSAHAVQLTQDRSGAEINNFLTPNPAGVTQLYVSNMPGPATAITIPALHTLSNRVLHRVELRVTELAPNTGPYAQLSNPPMLYLDAEYPDNPGNYRGLPYDLDPFGRYFCYPQTGPDFSYFGGPAKKEVINGQVYNQYVFNITRYTQSVITRNEPYFNFRLSAPYYLFYSTCASPNPAFPVNTFPFTINNSFINRLGAGRIRLAGGNHPDTRLRMQLRIIYSKA